MIKDKALKMSSTDKKKLDKKRQKNLATDLRGTQGLPVSAASATLAVPAAAALEIEFTVIPLRII